MLVMRKTRRLGEIERRERDSDSEREKGSAERTKGRESLSTHSVRTGILVPHIARAGGIC